MIKKFFLKCAEELNELATRLLQEINKDKDYTEQILEEIQDVEKQIKLLKNLLK